ncbi:zinc-binding alcohol dehydrogenase family protein [Actinoplanes sp. NBRC 103695]|uniref:quinone oxidoreductase family protein n=1 Tax=Actinoplanes sp. NBRC 103695 TaxID=3032202 RepID=UPI0024A55EE2|nr:zinc-binding alcohol dehydrogenase family protein [Actinoplanes sp. NBRC 103695]GLY94074.1 zinc-binding dehydrogenase [Actinoplanes sp. NBRC 103695]
MKAAVIHSADEAPRYEEFADPETAPGEVLVRVAATGLHPLVKARAAGLSYTADGLLPMIPGVDGIGHLEDGSRVYFLSPRAPYGTFSELTVAPAAACFPVPAGVDTTVGAAIMSPGLSSWLALTIRAPLTTGQSVLVLGATGPAGRLAIQAAKALGAGHVTAAGRDREALAGLANLGADAAVGLDPDELPHEHYDVILDYLWGKPAEVLLARLAKSFNGRGTARTRYIQLGESAGSTVTLTADTLRGTGLEMLGSGGGSVPMPQILLAIPEYLRRVETGDLRVDVEAVPLADVRTAWDRTQRGRRLVVAMDDQRPD